MVEAVVFTGLAWIVAVGGSALALYWVIRMAVGHAMRDVRNVRDVPKTF